jgi:hypothetical protein
MAGHAGHGIEGQSADCAGVESDDVGDVLAGMDGVEAYNFAGQMKTEHLFLALVVNHVAFEAASPNGCHRAEFVSRPEKMLSGLDRARTVNDLLEALGFVGCQASREAQFTQRATAARYLGSGGFTPIIADISHSQGTFHHALSK